MFPPGLARAIIRAGLPRRMRVDCGRPGKTVRQRYDVEVSEGPEQFNIETNWLPGGRCHAPVRPRVALDPFRGYGTALLVAREEGRSAVGVQGDLGERGRDGEKNALVAMGGGAAPRRRATQARGGTPRKPRRPIGRARTREGAGAAATAQSDGSRGYHLGLPPCHPHGGAGAPPQAPSATKQALRSSAGEPH